MTILYPAPRSVKSARKPFALGLARPNRERRAPFTSAELADLAALAEAAPCPATAPTEAEVRDHWESITLSAAEYRALRADLAAACRERYAAVELAELAELRMTDAEMEARAEEVRQADLADAGVRAW